MTKPETKEVKKILANVDREYVEKLIDKVNLSLRDKEIIKATELDKERISEVADKMCLSVDSIAKIKQSAMNRIYLYFMQKNYIKNTKVINSQE